MYVSLRLLPTTGENSMSTALLEIHLLKNGDVFGIYFTRCM